MNIEPGEYIRTKQGDIDKVIWEYTGKCANPNCTKKHISCKLNYYDEEDIVSHSKNIIDLIQVGDYVDGHLVVEHAHEKGRLFVSCTYVGGIAFTTFEDYSWELTKNKEENIETIVTKEQFEHMEYRL